MRKGLYLGRKISHRKREGERDSERERERDHATNGIKEESFGECSLNISILKITTLMLVKRQLASIQIFLSTIVVASQYCTDCLRYRGVRCCDGICYIVRSPKF